MNEIEMLLIQAWKLAVQNNKMGLAEAIVSLPGAFVTKPLETQPDKNRFSRAIFRIPSGKFRGKALSELDNHELQRVWSGFNGCGNTKVADILKAEMDLRH